MKDNLDDYARGIGAAADKPVVSPQQFYYDGSRYYLDDGTKIVPMDQKSVYRHLKATGEYGPADLDHALNEIQLDRYVVYAGPLAGHRRGLYNYAGANLLATCSPDIIAARGGECPTIMAFLRGILGDDEIAGNQQLKYFLSWLKVARSSLLHGSYRPGQALILAGPAGGGKSLLIKLISMVLGGRVGKPYPYFSGRTSFNGDLAGTELLAVDDDCGSTDIRARRSLAASIKNSLFAGEVRIEGKHKNGFVFRPFWRMVIACNDEPEALLVLPPVTEDVADKLTIFRCHRRKLPMPVDTDEERDSFIRKLREELPALLHYLEQCEIPEGMREARCGVKFFHHPEILESLSELSPEMAMLGLVDSLADSRLLIMPWEGTAADLRSALLTSPSTSRDADRLLSWGPAAGTYLGRLVGDRVEKLGKVHGIQRWQIKRRGS